MEATQPSNELPVGLPPAAQRVQATLQALGLTLAVREFPQGTRTAQDAANAVGCAVGQIVKSLIFKAADGSGVPPLAHTEPLLTLIDEDLLHYGEIWAAAGTPSTVFRLTPAELTRVAPLARIARIKPGP